MRDFGELRAKAIKQQVRPWGGLNERANQALSAVPRERFVPEAYQSLCFADSDIPLADGAFMFAPKIEGRILDMLNIQNDENVLEIGTGSGYLTAVISHLAKHITSIEISKILYQNALQTLSELRCENVKLLLGDALEMSFKNKKFDVILFGASVPILPEHYQDLLNIGGRLFVVEGTGHCMRAELITRLSNDEWTKKCEFETYIHPIKGLEQKPSFTF